MPQTPQSSEERNSRVNRFGKDRRALDDDGGREVRRFSRSSMRGCGWSRTALWSLGPDAGVRS